MARKRYKIGKISELMGMTSEALRYYEREGIVEPEKDPVSGYRMYTAWDLHILIRIRMFRRYGLTLEESAYALRNCDADCIDQILEEKAHDLEEKIREEERLLARLKKDRYSLKEAQKNIGKFKVEINPAMRFLDTQRSYSIIDEKTELYSKWIDKVPYVSSGGIFEFTAAEGELRYGLMIDEDQVKSLGGGFTEGAVAIPPQKCLVTFFESGSEKELGPKMFLPAIDFLHEHNLEMAGDPFAKVRMMYAGENEYYSLYQGWVPFEGDFCLCDPVSIEGA